MQRTKSKILSILLSLVMLLSLLPTTALAASPDADVALYNNAGKLISLSDKQYLKTNSDTIASENYTDSETYVARYEASSGTLFLKDYEGVGKDGGIVVVGDLNIVVESDSSFTTSRTSSTDSLMGIQSSNGKLKISGNSKLAVSANGNGVVYGIFAGEGVTISAPLDVTVKLNDSSKTLVYGIYTKSGAISLSGGDKAITVTGGGSSIYGVYNATKTSTITDNGNIDIRGKLTVNLNKGNNNVGIRTVSGGTITLDGATVNIPSNFLFGIYNKDNNNGNVAIRNGSNVTLASDITDGCGICANYGGDLSIENSTVKVSTKGYAADLKKGSLSIKDSTVDLTLDDNFNRVVNTDNNAANKIDLSTSGSVTLTASGNQTNAMINGNVTLGANTKCETGKPDGNSYDGKYDAASNKTVLKFVHKSTTPTATVDAVTIDGTTGTAIAATDVTITLTNDKFNEIAAATDVKGWFTNLPTGLEAKIKTDVSANATTATVEISGTPSAASSEVLVIKIPAANLASGSNLDVTSNANAKYNITDPAYSVDITAGTGMALTSGASNQTGLTGAMAEVVYTANTDYYFPTTYSVASVNGVDVTRIDFTKIKVSGTPTANTTITLADATAKTKEATPTATFTAESENGGKLSSVDNTMRYSVDGGGTWNAITGDNMPITNVTTTNGVQVKKPATDSNTMLDSDVKSITVTKATAPTGVTAVDCTTNSNDNGKLKNVTADMEYQKSGDPTWTACSGTEVSGLTNGTYLVRVKATGTVLASDNQSVTINAFGTTPAAEPNASFTATGRDAGALVISGTYTSTMKYSVDGGSVWNDVTSASMDITGVTAANGIQVKDVGNGSTTSESTVKSITVTEGAKPTGLTVTQPSTIGGKGKIETTASHEYNTDGGTTFTSCAGALDNLTAGAYHVRVKANGTMLASETETYTITAFTATQETKPNATFAATGPDSGTLSNLVNGGEYAVTGAAVVNFTASGTTHDLNGVSAGALSIVKKGNGTTTTDSTAQTITVTKAATPSTVTAVGCTTGSNNDGKLKNVTTAMEYQKSGATAWTPGTGSDISGLTNGTYYVRVKANGTELASDNQTVVIAAYVAPTEYTITFDGNGGTPSASNMTTVGKKLSSLPTATHSGSYSFAGWYTAASGGTQITTVYTFSANTTVYAHWTYTGGGGSSSGGGGGSYSPSYSITPGKSENGSITVSPKSARKGDTVTITVTPDKGYELEDLTVLDSKGKELALTEKNGKYSFKMPAGKVEVKATFIKEAEISPFDDVSTNAYYYEAVKWAQEKGITGGVGNGLFAPNQPCTRAQIVTFLWRAAGSPAPKNTGTAFGDVKPGSFYEQAVAWAVENGITGGTGDGMFSPDATCTRAQSVTFLYRAAGSPAVSGSAEFGDVATNAYYADAVAWAAKNGITGGIGGGQFGSGNDCTRGQIVTFLYRAYNK
ncbi:S-layer homology domain-containing protein [Oscillibacter sp. MSJ-31]|uniref:S-layer homology domain-containing protein n=1 Tax=Oscillibacter sp. MSJ-31 TaxID=2841526 RepID=UPI001C118CB7|nr:S-layer homology domain-containing protein [Oscillibacter sp. MSJ-31]MBU5456402.1 S-layer homology domain-containing protein [Oscillibacter sp. MSJ-31]